MLEQSKVHTCTLMMSKFVDMSEVFVHEQTVLCLAVPSSLSDSEE